MGTVRFTAAGETATLTLPPDLRPSGPGYVRYEDLYRAGDTVSAALRRLTQRAVVTFPEGRFDATDFAEPNACAISVPAICSGIVGSGRGELGGSTGTVFGIRPRTSTRLGSVPTQEGTPNEYNVLKCTDPSGPVEFRRFRVEGTDQGHGFSGFQYHNGPGRTPHPTLFEDLLITGWEGDSGIPPGETSALAVGGLGAHVIRRVEVDGRRAPGGITYAAMGITVQNSVGALVDDCHGHHCRAATFVAFQSVNGVLRNFRSDAVLDKITGQRSELGNGSLNFERTTGWRVEGDRTRIVGRQRKVHVTHSNDSFVLTSGGVVYPVARGTLVLQVPAGAWNGLWRPDETGDYLYVQSWTPYWNGDTMSYPATAPRLLRPDGTLLPLLKYVAAGGRGVITA